MNVKEIMKEITKRLKEKGVNAPFINLIIKTYELETKDLDTIVEVIKEIKEELRWDVSVSELKRATRMSIYLKEADRLKYGNK